jgi:SAM-dependent methyltransferase
LFKLIELSLADTHRFYHYKQTFSIDLEFGLKGFDYGWLLASHDWRSAEKVLDVGGAYSQLPLYIQQQHGCETWVVDDFGLNVNDPFWARNRSPQEYIDQHPQVRYILERVGDSNHSSLQQGYFDVVYSISALEHVPWDLTPAVWQHMVSLVKPGGELIHAIDIPFASNGGLSKMIKATLFDAFSLLVPISYQSLHYLATPMNYARLVFRILGIHAPISPSLNVWHMALDPEIMIEGCEYGYNRIIKDQMNEYHYQRTASLLIHLRKD